jgi:hypothetical protein
MIELPGGETDQGHEMQEFGAVGTPFERAQAEALGFDQPSCAQFAGHDVTGRDDLFGGERVHNDSR